MIYEIYIITEPTFLEYCFIYFIWGMTALITCDYLYRVFFDYDAEIAAYEESKFWSNLLLFVYPIQPKPFKAKNRLYIHIDGKWPNYVVTIGIKNTNTTLGIKRYLKNQTKYNAVKIKNNPLPFFVYKMRKSA